MTSINFDMSLRNFIEKASSNDPTPGGGSIAALASALGASMTSMVSNLSTGPKYSDHEDEIHKTIKMMEEHIDQCEDLLDKDIQAFNAFMNVLKMPKVTEEEKTLRTVEMQKAVINATEIPFAIAALGLEGLKSTLNIAPYANKTAISDIGVSAHLLSASILSVLLTVDINLPLLKNEELCYQYQQKRNDLEFASTRLRDDIIKIVTERIKG